MVFNSNRTLKSIWCHTGRIGRLWTDCGIKLRKEPDRLEIIDRAFKAEKHIQPYVFTDGNADKSVERKFA